MERTNQDRTKRAEQSLLAAYSDVGDEDYSDAITDLMTDLLHLAHQQGIDPEQIIYLARMHFDEEMEPEGEEP